MSNCILNIYIHTHRLVLHEKYDLLSNWLSIRSSIVKDGQNRTEKQLSITAVLTVPWCGTTVMLLMSYSVYIMVVIPLTHCSYSYPNKTGKGLNQQDQSTIQQEMLIELNVLTKKKKMKTIWRWEGDVLGNEKGKLSWGWTWSRCIEYMYEVVKE